MVGDDPLVGAGDVHNVMVSRGVQAAFGSRHDKRHRIAPRAGKRTGRRVFDAIGFLARVVLRPGSVVDTLPFVDPNGFAEVARYPADCARFVKR